MKRAVAHDSFTDQEKANKMLMNLIDDPPGQSFALSSRRFPNSPAVNRNPEVAFTALMLGGRNELLPNPFDEFDPHHKISGKKVFNKGDVRALQAKIDLRQPITLYENFEIK